MFAGIDMAGIDTGVLSGIVTAVLIVLFVGIWIWAYRSKRRATFDAAARMPLEEDAHRHPEKRP